MVNPNININQIERERESKKETERVHDFLKNKRNASKI